MLQLIKKGNKSSAIAMFGNAVIAIVKFIAGSLSGSGAMFASAMHSLADAVNQGFVFIGSVLSEREANRRFPTGFGRVVHIFCMVAVIVVTIMAYETLLEGWHLLQHPVASSKGFWLNVTVLFFNMLVDGAILWKAMNEINVESRSGAKGWAIVTNSFRNVRRAAPPTRLVFYEDIVAVTGALLALVAVVFVALFNMAILDGIVTLLIGVLMLFVAFRVGYDNMVGLIGVAAPVDVEERIANLILADVDVTDINKMRITQEGRYYHVEAMIELRPGLLLSDADDIKFRVHNKVLADYDVSDVGISIIEDNGVRDWVPPTERLRE